MKEFLRTLHKKGNKPRIIFCVNEAFFFLIAADGDAYRDLSLTKIQRMSDGGVRPMMPRHNPYT